MKNRPTNPAVIKLCKEFNTSIEGQKARDFFSNPENLEKIKEKLKEAGRLNQCLRESRIVTPEVRNMLIGVSTN
jgi:hypothetical protein